MAFVCSSRKWRNCGIPRLVMMARKRSPADSPERRRELYKQFKDRHVGYALAWARGHREQVNAYAKAWRVRIKQEAFYAYGGKCACCGETEPNFLSIDHVYGGGRKHRELIHSSHGGGSGIYRWLKQERYPQDGRFQVLCHNCNFAKRLGQCPHRQNQ